MDRFHWRILHTEAAAGVNLCFTLFFIQYLDYIVEEVINVVRLTYESLQVLH